MCPTALGRDCPGIREWTQPHFDFAGYISGFDAAELGDRERLRAEAGFAKHEKVCLVTVGGTGVGGALLRKVMAAYPAAKRAIPELRMIVVTGPRIDTEALPIVNELKVRALCPRPLPPPGRVRPRRRAGRADHLDGTDRRGTPFLYFPLRHHFEQNFHVAHRLDNYRAGRRMDFDTATPDVLAQAIGEEIGRTVDYLPVETGGARTAAARIAELLN